MVLAGGMIARSECLQAGKPAAEKSIPQSVVQSRQETQSYQATEHRGRLNLSCLQVEKARPHPSELRRKGIANHHQCGYYDDMIILSMFTNMLLYVGSIIVCTVSATLYIRFSLRRKGKLYRMVSTLLCSFLFYTVFEMFVTFFTQLEIPIGLFHILTTLSDAAYFCVVASWVSVIIVISGNPYLINAKGFVIYTAVYGVSVDGLNLLVKFIPNAMPLDQQTASSIMLYLNVIFDITVILIALGFIFYGALKIKGDKQQRWAIFLSLCLTVYMIYITNWDVISCKDVVPNEILFSSFDPAHILYLIVCGLTLYMVARKGSVRADYYMPAAFGISSERGGDFSQIGRAYKLTSRELEVAAALCEGMSNPQIAEALYISESTVKQHLSHMHGAYNTYFFTVSKG